MRVLGISPFHDSSVAIITDGKIEFFSKEERLSRKKRDYPPKFSLDTVLKTGKDFDEIVISSPSFDDPLNTELEKYINLYRKNKVIRMCNEHHLTHASLAFYNSGFDKALVVVIDRYGSKLKNVRESESVYVAEYPHSFFPILKNYSLINHKDTNKDVLTEIRKKYPTSDVNIGNEMNITKVYESATTMIGQHGLENGKTMGLSAYGEDKPFKDLFDGDTPDQSLFDSKDDDIRQVYFKEYKEDETKDVPKDNYSLYANYAFQVQKQTQQKVLSMVQNAIKQTGIRKICITGGYGLNVLTNSYLLKHLPGVDLYFEPLADDSGNSLGAAMYVYREKTKDKKKYTLTTTSFNYLKNLPQVQGKKVRTKDVAKYLEEQKIVAVYCGQSEAGPRALGNRSILFDPRNSRGKEIVNKVKNREWYRPFGCSILERYCNDYFSMYGLKKSPFMTNAFKIRNTKKFPAITHIDGTSRIQTVDRNIPHLFELLTEFNSLTNVPMLLNTSFNTSKEAMVESPEDALHTFNTTDIDVLWFPEKQMVITK
jgi:carbamoyltransferase